MRTRLLRTSVVGALALGLMAGGAAPAMAGAEVDNEGPVIESVSVTLPDAGRDWIKPGETATLEVVYTDKWPTDYAVQRMSDPTTPLPGGHHHYMLPMPRDLSSDVPAPEMLPDGSQRVTLRYKLQPDESSVYGTYWTKGEQDWRIELRDLWNNTSTAELPEVRVDDPDHPIAGAVSLESSQGEPGRLFEVPTDCGQISVGDTLRVDGGAVGAASDRFEWHETYSDDSPELVSGDTVVAGNGAGELKIGQYRIKYVATWPDGVVRSRSWNSEVGNHWVNGPLTVNPVYVNLGRVVLDRPAKVGASSTARFEFSRPDLPFTLGAPTFKWSLNGRNISGATASLVPGDTYYRVDASFNSGLPYAYAVDEDATQFSVAGTVGAGTMPDAAVTFGAAKVGIPLVATVGPSKGASRVTVHWVVDGKNLPYGDEEVPVAGGKIAWIPEAKFVGKSVKLAVNRFYGSSGASAPTQLSAAQALIAPGAQSLPAPRISGTVRVGSKLTLEQYADLVPGAKRSIVWLKNGRVIPGATGWSYTPVAGDKGAKLSAKITVTAPGYVALVSQAAAKSVAVGVLKRGQVGYFSKYQTVGETWRADVHGWDRGVTVKYQWLRDGKAIKKATARKYKLTRADRKHKVSLRITVSKAGYTSVTKTSNWNRVY